MIEPRAIRREREAVREHHAVPNRARGAVEVDDVQMSWRRRLPALGRRSARAKFLGQRGPRQRWQGVKRERADVDPTRGVHRQIVEAGQVRGDDVVEKHHRGTAVEALERDVPAADDEAARDVSRHPADPAPMRNDRRDLARCGAAVHATVEHVAPVQPAARLPHRRLDQTVAGRQLFHADRAHTWRGDGARAESPAAATPSSIRDASATTRRMSSP